MHRHNWPQTISIGWKYCFYNHMWIRTQLTCLCLWLHERQAVSVIYHIIYHRANSTELPYILMRVQIIKLKWHQWQISNLIYTSNNITWPAMSAVSCRVAHNLRTLHIPVLMTRRLLHTLLAFPVYVSVNADHCHFKVYNNWGLLRYSALVLFLKASNVWHSNTPHIIYIILK